MTRRVLTAEGVIEIWSAADALVLKATALVLQKESPRCCHRVAFTWPVMAG